MMNNYNEILTFKSIEITIQWHIRVKQNLEENSCQKEISFCNIKEQ